LIDPCGHESAAVSRRKRHRQTDQASGKREPAYYSTNAEQKRKEVFARSLFSRLLFCCLPRDEFHGIIERRDFGQFVR
jgi:hypothetical protein